MTNDTEIPIADDSTVAGNSRTLPPVIPRTTPITPRLLNFEEEGDMPSPEEQQEMFMKWREEQKAKGKRKEMEKERSSREAERLAKKREADRLRLEALKLQREEIELQEKALREALEAEDPEPEDRRDKRTRTRNDEDESGDSESHSRRTRSKVVYSSRKKMVLIRTTVSVGSRKLCSEKEGLAMSQWLPKMSSSSDHLREGNSQRCMNSMEKVTPKTIVRSMNRS